MNDRGEEDGTLIDLTGHVVVVTGAGQGIRRVIAESFAMVPRRP